ncbi:hypothetical protein [Nocardia paucivorans]|uniref:hypothetical protein n=1 Tax=Nocardia paucivorans TaxID=114259 RepID=UPI0002E73AE9|nr:hypothetical protein [Nocardia paucivorans]
MSFLFAVLPAAATDSAEQAYEQYVAMERAPEPTAPLPVVGVVYALIDRADAGLSVHRPPDGRGLLLRATVDDRIACLSALLTLTGERDLAVFDVTARRLYSPRRRARMPITVGEITLPYLTEELLRELLDNPSTPTLTVTRAPMCHIGTRRLPEGVHELEHRRIDDFYRLLTDNTELVHKTIWAWATDDPWWQQAIAWQPVTARTDEPTNPEDDIDTVMAELRRMAEETSDLPTLDLISTLNDLDSHTRAILDRAEDDEPPVD